MNFILVQRDVDPVDLIRLADSGLAGAVSASGGASSHAAIIARGLGVPMLGNWFDLAGVILLELFAALSIGFVISLMAQSDSQAVQSSMLVLLASVLFSVAFW